MVEHLQQKRHCRFAKIWRSSPVKKQLRRLDRRGVDAAAEAFGVALPCRIKNCINNHDANIYAFTACLIIICVIVIDAKLSSVGDLASLQGGYPFRGSIEESSEGGVLAVQMKDVDPEHGVNWSGVIRTSLVGRKQPNWLKAGDVLFVSKGARFYAVCIDEPPTEAVCSPHFFLLQVLPRAVLLPAFLAWQINQPPFQRQLQQAAEGSSQMSIRRPVLESLTLSVPSLADQQRIVALADLARQERHTLHQLIHNREQQLQALAEGLAYAAQATH